MGTADQLLAQVPPVISRIFNPVTPEVLNELITNLPDFKRGYEDDGIHVGEYDEFGPVELFRGSFVKSWQRVLNVIKQRRQVLAG